jgi:hypothetical protein
LAVGLLVGKADSFGPNMTNVALLGAALGAVAGLVNEGSAVTRIGAVGLGLVIADLGYAARASVLPDSGSGRAIAAAAAILVLTGLAVAGVGRLRLWALLLGAGAFVGAYETVYTASPTTYVHDSVSVASAVLLGLGIGFAVTSLLAAATEPSTSPKPPGTPWRGRFPRPRATSDTVAGTGVEATGSTRTGA